MSINTIEGLDILRQLSDNYVYQLRKRRLGILLSIGDGIASVGGIRNAKLDELLEFNNGVKGLILNLDSESIDCILLGSTEGMQVGSPVIRTENRIEVPVGDELLGRVIDHLGNPLDGKGPIKNRDTSFIERLAPGVLDRQPVQEPLQTGLKIIDAVVPLGRGQRELILGDRQTGKTSVAIDTIINQKNTGVRCVYVSIGHEKSEISSLIAMLRDNGAMDYTTVVVASSDSPPANLYIAAYSGCTIAEWFLYRGQHSLIIYDDLSRHALAYRELSLLLRRPPGREAYPGDIFYIHARLLERSCKLSDDKGGGSMTAIPIAETKEGNISAYIPTNLISITDGQIYLNADLYNRGFRPAVDIGISVSRVGGEAQTKSLKNASTNLRLIISQYEEIQRFVRFGADVEESTQKQLIHGAHIRQILNQPPLSPLSVQREVAIVYSATKGFLDDIPLDKLDDFEKGLESYIKENHADLWSMLATDWNSTVEEELKSAIDEYKKVQDFSSNTDKPEVDHAPTDSDSK